MKRVTTYLAHKPALLAHVQAVAEINRQIAEQYDLNADVCELCGWLHDLGAALTPEEMLAQAAEQEWALCEAERNYPSLLHQRVSALLAERDFGVTDERVLSAVACHSTLRENASAYDMALFVADKLSWDVPTLRDALRKGLKYSLEATSLVYVDFAIENKMISQPHPWFEQGATWLRHHEKIAKKA